MDPQMVWDAMDECDEECAKAKAAAKEATKTESTPEPEAKPKEKCQSYGFFGFPFGGSR